MSGAIRWNGLRLVRVLVGGAVARLGYLIVTVAVAAAAWLALSTMAGVFLTGASSGQVNYPGVKIGNGIQPGRGLPLPYMRRLENLAGAENVNWGTLLVVSCKQAPIIRAVLTALGGPGAGARVSYLTATHQHPVDRAMLARWLADPLGVLVSRHAAAKCDWRAGEGVEAPGLVGGKPVTLHIDGVLQAAIDGDGFAHFEYVNRIGAGLIGKDKVLFVHARANTLRGNERLAARIETAFAHDMPNVSANTDATSQNAGARFGEAQQLLTFVMAMILLCMSSVMISVMAHSAAQRRPRFALLQVLGFTRRTVLIAVALEGLSIIVAGAALGLGAGRLAEHVIGSSTALGRLFVGYAFTPPTWAYLWMVVWLTGLWFATLIAPARVIQRTRAIDHQAE